VSPQQKEARRLKAGQAQMARKDFTRAILEFQSAAQAMPRDAEPQYQLGLAYLAARNVRGAVTSLRKATELNPKHWEANLKLTEILATTRNAAVLDDAAKRLHEILANSPQNADALDTLAITEVKQGKTEEASRRLEETFQKFPRHLLTAVVLARLKLAQKDMPGAEEVLLKTVAKAPQSGPAVLALAQFYLIGRQPEKAKVNAARALQLEPNDPEALWTLAAAQTLGKHTDEANRTYQLIAALPDKRFRAAHALFLYQAGKPDAAALELKQLTARYPDDEDTRSKLVVLYLETNKIPEAEALVAEALKRNSKNTDALFQRSELSLRAGNPVAAEKDLRSVLQMRPDSATAHFLLATVQQAQGLDGNARHELSEALKYDPHLLQARIALARELLADNQAKPAIEILDGAPDSQKRTVALVVERNWALLKAGETQQLRASLDRILSSTRLPEFVLQDALLKLRQGDYTGARLAAEEVLRANPEDVRAAGAVARSLNAQNQRVKALQRLEEIVAARPKSMPLRELLGEWYLASGKLGEARTAFETARNEDVKSVTPELALADLDRREKHPDAALERLTRVAAGAPHNITVTMMTADVERETGNLPEAIQKYQSALTIDPSNLTALNNLAYLLALENPGEALKYAQQAAEIAPDSAAVEDTLGWVHYRQRNYSSALVYLKAAASKDPTPQHQFHLAQCYFKTGDKDTGEQLLIKALQKDPNLPGQEKGW
jgi:tetratricopeptide (TPR) repeat protein